MVENKISEFAIIFMRAKTEYDLVEQFVPVRVVEGYYHEDDQCFVDVDQNVYSHMADLVDYGNVYAGRSDMIDVIKENEKVSIMEIKRKILKELSKYDFFKNIDESSDTFGIIKIRNKETGEYAIFKDKDTELFYTVYTEVKNYLGGQVIKKDNAPKEEKTESDSKEEIDNSKRSSTPDEIINEIKKTIKGQDEAVEKIATLIWIRYNLPMIDKTNMLVLGPSGVGKTAIFKKIKQILNIPLSIYSVTGTSQAGYKGHDIEEMLAQLYFDAGEDLKLAEHGIVIIDEFDKISNNRDNGEIGTTAIQNELLTLIEGCERVVPLDNHTNINMDTSNIIFVGCGAFSNLFEQEEKKTNVIGFESDTKQETTKKQITVDTETIINKGGIIRELAGRLPVIIQLNDLNNNREVLKDILLNSDESKFRQIIEAINSLGIEIENIDIVVDALIDDAISKKIGARGLVSSLMGLFIKIFKEAGNNPGKYSKLIIGNNLIKDPTDYKLIEKRTKRKVKKKTEEN